MMSWGFGQWIQSKSRSVRLAWFPPACLLCRQPAQQHLDICTGCQTDLTAMDACCQRCAEPLAQSHSLCGRCQQQLPLFDSVFAPYLYAQPLTQLVTAFKFKRQPSAGQAMGLLLAEAVAIAVESGELSLPDCLVPVPLHPWRQIKRGFNQSALLADDVAKHLRQMEMTVPVAGSMLQRIRRTRPQPGLSLVERRRNLKGAFSLKGNPPRHVALIDDVMTSGNTANECARILKQAGCEVVQVWVAARAERPK